MGSSTEQRPSFRIDVQAARTRIFLFMRFVKASTAASTLVLAALRFWICCVYCVPLLSVLEAGNVLCTVHSHAGVMYPAYTCRNISCRSEIHTSKIVQNKTRKVDLVVERGTKIVILNEKRKRAKIVRPFPHP